MPTRRWPRKSSDGVPASRSRPPGRGRRPRSPDDRHSPKATLSRHRPSSARSSAALAAVATCQCRSSMVTTASSAAQRTALTRMHPHAAGNIGQVAYFRYVRPQGALRSGVEGVGAEWVAPRARENPEPRDAFLVETKGKEPTPPLKLSGRRAVDQQRGKGYVQPYC